MKYKTGEKYLVSTAKEFAEMQNVDLEQVLAWVEEGRLLIAWKARPMIEQRFLQKLAERIAPEKQE